MDHHIQNWKQTHIEFRSLSIYFQLCFTWGVKKGYLFHIFAYNLFSVRLSSLIQDIDILCARNNFSVDHLFDYRAYAFSNDRLVWRRKKKDKQVERLTFIFITFNMH